MPLFLGVASCHVEGGMYVGPEFLLGQVYDGTTVRSDPVILYRPLYVCVNNHWQLMSSNSPQLSEKSITWLNEATKWILLLLRDLWKVIKKYI